MRERKANTCLPLSKLLASPPGKKGFYWGRYSFSGCHTATRKTRFFFIEFSAVSIRRQPPKAAPPVEGSFDLLKIVAPNAVLPEGTAQIPQEMPGKYVQVRAGISGKDGRMFEARFPFSAVSVTGDEVSIQDGQIKFSESKLKGMVRKGIFWELSLSNAQPGGGTQFAGTLRIDRDEYSVSPGLSQGHMDRMYGSDLPERWFYLSCAHLVSNINGRKLEHSFFESHGIFSNKITVVAVINGIRYEFNVKKLFSRSTQTFNCTKTGDAIHWSVSIQRRTLVIDIDVSCKTTDLKLKVYDLPQAENKSIEILSGVTGKAEIRLYKPTGKTLELIEYARSSHTLCEYGETKQELFEI
ncbi:MAG: hypothetical protein LBS97_00520 [Treponema sp.]|jgi:hypothetical protein|nr:hypothetical protein [Treponema sp.]